MKYYVRKDASSEIEGPFELEAIRGWIANGRFTMEDEAVEDRGRSTDEIRRSRMWRTLEEVFAEPPSERNAQSPKVFLAAVREQSCYKTLRLCIDLTVLASWAACAFFLFTRFSSSPDLLVLSIVLMAIGGVGFLALRQSAYVIVDIADVLIEQTRRK
jgi:hypothetical protein